MLLCDGHSDVHTNMCRGAEAGGPATTPMQHAKIGSSCPRTAMRRSGHVPRTPASTSSLQNVNDISPEDSPLQARPRAIPAACNPSSETSLKARPWPSDRGKPAGGMIAGGVLKSIAAFHQQEGIFGLEQAAIVSEPPAPVLDDCTFISQPANVAHSGQRTASSNAHVHGTMGNGHPASSASRLIPIQRHSDSGISSPGDSAWQQRPFHGIPSTKAIDQRHSLAHIHRSSSHAAMSPASSMMTDSQELPLCSLHHTPAVATPLPRISQASHANMSPASSMGPDFQERPDHSVHCIPTAMISTSHSRPADVPSASSSRPDIIAQELPMRSRHQAPSAQASMPHSHLPHPTQQTCSNLDGRLESRPGGDMRPGLTPRHSLPSSNRAPGILQRAQQACHGSSEDSPSGSMHAGHATGSPLPTSNDGQAGSQGNHCFLTSSHQQMPLSSVRPPGGWSSLGNALTSPHDSMRSSVGGTSQHRSTAHMRPHLPTRHSMPPVLSSRFRPPGPNDTALRRMQQPRTSLDHSGTCAMLDAGTLLAEEATAPCSDPCTRGSHIPIASMPQTEPRHSLSVDGSSNPSTALPSPLAPADISAGCQMHSPFNARHMQHPAAQNMLPTAPASAPARVPSMRPKQGANVTPAISSFCAPGSDMSTPAFIQPVLPITAEACEVWHKHPSEAEPNADARPAKRQHTDAHPGCMSVDSDPGLSGSGPLEFQCDGVFEALPAVASGGAAGPHTQPGAGADEQHLPAAIAEDLSAEAVPDTTASAAPDLSSGMAFSQCCCVCKTAAPNTVMRKVSSYCHCTQLQT